ncbi:MAG: prepilin peptidase [Coriobacteriia bacterium]|nr:prepilin peptidase [Coriobacteriia bacterium]
MMIDPHFIRYALTGAFFLFGVIFGSFGNVVIWRLPRKESLSFPPSHCPTCGSPIKPYDNIPVLSFLVLKGKCRTCHEAISIRYPLVELSGGILFAVAALIGTNLIQAIFLSVFLYLLMLLSFIDYDTKRLPNSLVATLGVLSLTAVVLTLIPGCMNTLAQSTSLPRTVALTASAQKSTFAPIVEGIIGILLAAGPAALIAFLYRTLRHKSGFGMGDIKLLIVIGLFLGRFGGLVLPVAAIIGLLAIGSAKLGNRTVSLSMKIPFGPFIALATFVILLFGQNLWIGYTGLLF